MITTLSQILVLTTGGTIDKAYFDALSAYQIGESQIARLLDTARMRYPFEIQELMRKDSLDLSETDRALIADTVSHAKAGRIIITHGTDTMIDTAESLGVHPDKVIVFVGALAPARFNDSDAAFNLGMAFATAQIAPPGIYITMNGTVFPAHQVRKDRAQGSFVHCQRG